MITRNNGTSRRVEIAVQYKVHPNAALFPIPSLSHSDRPNVASLRLAVVEAWLAAVPGTPYNK